MTPAKIFPARPTVYNGIKMRSRLEAKFAATLDAVGERWAYEPNCFASPDGQYLPDFAVVSDGVERYIEIKPGYLADDLEAIRKIQIRMEIIWASEPDVTLDLHFPETGDLYRAGYQGSPWLHADHEYEIPILCDICNLAVWPIQRHREIEEERLRARRNGWFMKGLCDFCPPCVATVRTVDEILADMRAIADEAGSDDLTDDQHRRALSLYEESANRSCIDEG